MVDSKQMAAIGPLMGDLMKQFRGKVSGERLSVALKKAIVKKS